MKPTECPAREKNKARIERRGEERKQKEKVKTAVSLLNPKTLKILCSAPSQTSHTDILHVDQKAAKFTTCKQVSGMF